MVGIGVGVVGGIGCVVGGCQLGMCRWLVCVCCIGYVCWGLG